MNKIIKISAISNFIRLGLLENNNVYALLKKWIKYQNCLQKILQHLSFDDFNYESKNTREIDLNCRFFITAHFGIYPLIIIYLANLFPQKKIVVLIGKQKSLLYLSQLAEKYSINLTFVEVGESFIFFRKCIKLNKEGCVFVSLIDIPLGISDKTESTLTFLNGNMRVKAGLLKIADKLKLSPRFIVSGFNHSTHQVPINSYFIENINDVFSIFQKYIRKEPYLWDKIIDLNKFYQSDIEPDIYLPFKLSDEFFIMDIANDKFLRINKPLYLKINHLRNKTQTIKEVEHCRDTIYEQTNLYIRKAV